MRSLVFILSLFFLVLALPTSVIGASQDASVIPDDNDIQEYYSKAMVLGIENVDNEFNNQNGGMMQEQLVKVKILTGDYSGRVLFARNTLSGSAGIDIEVNEGEKIIVYISETIPSGSEKPEIIDVYVVEHVRSGAYKILVGLFMLLLVVIGGVQGVKALVGLGFTGAGVFLVLLPALAQGKSPLLATIPVLLAVTLLTMVVVAGFTRKALAATLGTAGGLLVAGVLAMFVGDLGFMQGLGTEEERLLLYIENVTLNTQGILFAGILLGALGAVMDVAMSVSSAVEEVRKANPELSSAQLTRAGMQVGKDIMGTMANTLILAYTGGALPFLLLYITYQTPSVYMLNTELIGSEVLRAMAGSIGLIVSVPITAILAGILNKNSTVANRQFTPSSRMTD